MITSHTLHIFKERTVSPYLQQKTFLKPRDFPATWRVSHVLPWCTMKNIEYQLVESQAANRTLSENVIICIIQIWKIMHIIAIIYNIIMLTLVMDNSFLASFSDEVLYVR